MASEPQREGPEEDPSGIGPVGPEFPQRKRFWHLNRCQNAVYAPASRPPEDYPDPEGPGAKGFKPGFFEVRSTHQVRAVEMHDPGNVEVCGFHYGKMSTGVDGFDRPVCCSLPYSSDVEEFSRVSVLIPFANERTETWHGIKPGFFGFLGAYQTPFVTEAVFHSDIVTCGDGET